jgi:hypothetical protein
MEYGGRASQNQQLRFSRRPYFICTVFESIRLLCAQYLRNISRDRLLSIRPNRSVALEFLSAPFSSQTRVCQKLWFDT